MSLIALFQEHSRVSQLLDTSGTVAQSLSVGRATVQLPPTREMQYAMSIHVPIQSLVITKAYGKQHRRSFRNAENRRQKRGPTTKARFAARGETAESAHPSGQVRVPASEVLRR